MVCSVGAAADADRWAHIRMPSPTLLQQITEGYSLPLSGVHGLSHWGRVLVNGRRLADETGADPIVLELFAVFHDARRRNEGHDPQHGNRAARSAHALLSAEGHLSSARLKMLEEACRLHTNGLREADVTIQSCWDAGRLDLLRGARFLGQSCCVQRPRDNRP